MPLPHFVIIGAMKSATTSLQAQLALQSGIFMSEPKEPNFFSDDSQFEKGLPWYESLFEHAKDGDLRGEASTHYSKLPTHPKTVTRLKQWLPQARFIYVMRHPVDRLVSHYIHDWSMKLYRYDINQAVERNPELVAYSQYAMQLEPYFAAFGQQAVLPIFFDRLVREPQAELERVCRFIGYRDKPVWSYDEKPSNVSSQRIRRFPLYGPLIESPPATWLRHTLVPRALRAAIKDHLTMRNRPVLSEATRYTLEREFNRDLAQLSAWIGRRLDCSNFKHVTGSAELTWVSSSA